METYAVLYGRISDDRHGRSQSVPGQLDEATATATEYGWTIRETVTDVDRGASRYSLVDRPGFRSLRSILRPGDVLVTAETSRITRQLGEHAAFVEWCAERDIRWCIRGRLYNLNDAGDRAHLGYAAVSASEEVDRLRERVLRGTARRAKAGLPHSRIPWCYRRTVDLHTGRTLGIEPDPERAPIIRAIVDRTLDGESVFRIAREMNERGIPSPENSARGWTGPNLRALLIRPALAGIRRYKGEDYPGTWEPIVTIEEHDRLCAMFARTPTPSANRGPAPSSLLSAIAVCGVCGAPVDWRDARTNRSARYTCSAAAHCVSRVSGPVDALAESAMVDFFETEIGREAVQSESRGDALVEVRAELTQLQQRLEQAADEYAAGTLSIGMLTRLESRLTGRIDELQRLIELTEVPVLERFRHGGDPRTIWQALDLDSRRAIVRRCLRVEILPARAHTKIFDPTTVRITVIGGEMF
ncbi:recombinase family protein [Rhodococcus pyridinivorans]|uniref:recombinase family protein n=1 Tax=Rhodococcus pyridinivorans TaxID=103816 RepID=UPI000570E267|nr:recombinase family protein [Rhodococcus pyridinivorans]AWZ23803.1 recombinase family protein [Rhodococcus pyridinivorans]